MFNPFVAYFISFAMLLDGECRKCYNHTLADEDNDESVTSTTNRYPSFGTANEELLTKPELDRMYKKTNGNKGLIHFNRRNQAPSITDSKSSTVIESYQINAPFRIHRQTNIQEPIRGTCNALSVKQPCRVSTENIIQFMEITGNASRRESINILSEQDDNLEAALSTYYGSNRMLDTSTIDTRLCRLSDEEDSSLFSLQKRGTEKLEHGILSSILATRFEMNSGRNMSILDLEDLCHTLVQVTQSQVKLITEGLNQGMNQKDAISYIEDDICTLLEIIQDIDNPLILRRSCGQCTAYASRVGILAEMILMRGFLPKILDILSEKDIFPSLVCSLSSLLTCLLQYNPLISIEIVRLSGLKIILGTMRNYIDDITLISDCCCLLRVIVNQKEEWKIQLAELCGLEIVSRAMNTNKLAESLQISCCNLILSLAMSREIKLYVGNAVMAQILDLLEEYKNNPIVVHLGLKILWSLSINNQMKVSLVENTSALNSIFEIIQIFDDNESIQMSAWSTLSNVSNNGTMSLKRSIIRHDHGCIIRLTNDAMIRFQSNIEIVEKILLTLSRLVCDDIFSTLTNINIIDSLQMICEIHPSLRHRTENIIESLYE